eukprot:scaffold287606_cov20-Attheya_sp.AAC.1
MFISAAAHQENMNAPQAVAEPGTETATVAVAPAIAEAATCQAAFTRPWLPSALRFKVPVNTSTSSTSKKRNAIMPVNFREMIEKQPKPLQRSIQNLSDTMTESHKSVLAAEEKLHNWTRAEDSGSTFTPTSIKTKTHKVQNKELKDDPEYMGLVAILE